MVPMIRYCLICILLCKSFTSNADTIVSNFKTADSLYLSGNYDKAALAYERIIFLSRSDYERYKALLFKSYCYKKEQLYNNALKTLQRCNYLNINDSIRYTLYKESVLIAFLDGNYPDAESTLNLLNHSNIDSSKQYEYLYLGILTLNELQEWDEAAGLLKKYMNHKNLDPESKENKSLFVKPKLLNSKTAKTLSFILPGSGQIYSGKLFRGLSSIILNGSAITYSILSVEKGFYLSGIFTGFNLFMMFYTGGSRYAEYIANKENAKRVAAYNKKIRDFILTQESQ